MKRLLTVIGIATLAALTLASPAVDQIKKAHNDFVTATLKGDVDGAINVVHTYFAADFRNVMRKGAHNRQQFIDGLRQQMTQGTPTFARFTYGPFHVKKDTATVDTGFTVKFAMKDKEGKTHRMIHSDRSHEVWRREGGAWKLTLIKDLSAHTTMDGKPMKGM